MPPAFVRLVLYSGSYTLRLITAVHTRVCMFEVSLETRLWGAGKLPGVVAGNCYYHHWKTFKLNIKGTVSAYRG